MHSVFFSLFYTPNSGRGSLSKDGMQIKYTLSGSDDCNGELSGGGKLYYKE